MAENLRTGVMIPGNEQPTNNDIIEKWCLNNELASCNNLGGLYSWNEAMSYSSVSGAQGICPAGWHLPTDAEYHELEQFVLTKIQSPNSQFPCSLSASSASMDLKRCADASGAQGGVNGVGKSLKTLGQGTDVGVGDDLVGFKGVLVGKKFELGGWVYPNNAIHLWTSNNANTDNAYLRTILHSSSGVAAYYGKKVEGLSVRCIKDN